MNYNQNSVNNPNFKHGLKKHRIYTIWKGMKQRCLNPSKESDKIHYFDKNIKIYSLWINDVKAFYDWAIKNGYKDNLDIDRIDNNGNYCPENCRWVTKTINNRNRTKSKNTSSKFIGVYFNKKSKKWKSQIRIGNNIRKYIGSFKTEEEAVKARDLFIIENNLEGFKLQILTK